MQWLVLEGEYCSTKFECLNHDRDHDQVRSTLHSSYERYGAYVGEACEHYINAASTDVQPHVDSDYSKILLPSIMMPKPLKDFNIAVVGGGMSGLAW